MTQIEFAGWTVIVDVERTRRTYAAIDKCRWEVCGCEGCRNFGAVALTGLPGKFVAFLEAVGIPPLKPAEVYEFGEVHAGVRSYGGEYYFWGTVNQSAPAEIPDPRFSVGFISPSPLSQTEFKHDGAVCILFNAELPWVIASNAA